MHDGREDSRRVIADGSVHHGQLPAFQYLTIVNFMKTN